LIFNYFIIDITITSMMQ